MDGQTMTFKQVIHAWQNDIVFQDFYSELLARTPWKAFFWEHLLLSLVLQ